MTGTKCIWMIDRESKPPAVRLVISLKYSNGRFTVLRDIDGRRDVTTCFASDIFTSRGEAQRRLAVEVLGQP